MTPNELATAIDALIRKAVTEHLPANLAAPLSRSRHPQLPLASQWFAGLSEADRERLRDVLSMAASGAAFAVLAFLDGARESPLDGRHLDFRLFVKNQDGSEQEVPLDAPPLHELTP